MSLASLTRRRKKRVVIVDDSRTMQAVLEQILSLRLGLDVVGLAGDVETAVTMIESLNPDLVTIDLRLPYIDGKVLLERLSEHRTMHKVVISGHGCGNLAVVSTLEQLGADACIDKVEMSRDPARFCETILSILKQPKRGLSLSHKRATAQADAAAVQPSRYPIPMDEQARLDYLDEFDLANDDEDAQLDRLTAHLGRVTDFPTCLMTFMARDKQWIKSAYGFSRGSMPRAIAFCNYTLCSDDSFVVGDATLDERFCDNIGVVGAPGLRTYAGHPITSASGIRLGAICLLDNRPRQVSHSVLTSLRAVSDIAAGIIDTRSILLKKRA